MRLTLRAGEIETSLFAAADDAGLPDAVTLALADVFDGDIDFYHDLRRGDRFTVVYETRYVDGEAGRHRTHCRGGVREPRYARSAHSCGARPMARKATTTKRDARAQVVPALADGVFAHHVGLHAGALPPDPAVDGARIKGTDFAAPMGTPVRATADGVVVLAGTQNGYGNVVMLQHDGAYSTLYAHLSRFAAAVRSRARACIRATRSATSARPAGRPGRICITSCASTASRAIR